MPDDGPDPDDPDPRDEASPGAIGTDDAVPAETPPPALDEEEADRRSR